LEQLGPGELYQSIHRCLLKQDRENEESGEEEAEGDGHNCQANFQDTWLKCFGAL